MPTYSDCELAWTNLVGNSVKMFTYSGNGLLAKETARVHPTQKPVALMAWCMEVAKVPTGATVLDPYCGSGSTAIACIRTGRRFVGCEIDPGYFAIACDRIRRELAQGCLPFEPTPAQARCEPELQL
jgi:DNA modification methylase